MSRLAGERILIVLPGLSLAGAERQALLLAQHLRDEEGAEVLIWGLGLPGEVCDRCDALGLPWRLIRVGWPKQRMVRIKAILRFARELRRAQPDRILPYSMRPNVVCNLVWRGTGAKLCLWNQRDEGRSDRVEKNWQKLAVRLAGGWVSNALHGREFMVRELGLRESKIRHVPNGVNPAPAQKTGAQWRDEIGLSEDAVVVCMVAHLHIYKDHPNLLHAWRGMLDRLAEEQIDVDVRLLFAGRFEGNYENLLRLVEELDVASSVYFLGGVEDVSGLLEAVDLIAHSSVREGVPNGVLEPMSFGIPAVGTASPGLVEALGEDSTCLVPPREPEPLADRLFQLVCDAELRRSIGEKNRRRIAEEYAPEIMCRRMTSALLGESW